MALLVAGCGGGGGNDGGGESKTLDRRREHARSAARREVVDRLPATVGRDGHLRVDRLRRRDRADHRTHRRLRRERRAALARPGVELQGLPPGAVGAGRRPFPPTRSTACRTELKLSGPVLADIFLGKVTEWNDPEIARLNPGVQLPATRVVTVYRSDGSGDTYAFSDFLAKVSPEWKEKEGVSTQVSFPAGVGAKGSDGVAAVIGRTDGAIGYLPISYVVAGKLDSALVQNAAGKFPVPGIPSILAAARTATTIPAGQRDLDHQPAGFGARRVPDLDVHVRDRPEELRQGLDTAAVPHVRGHGWPEVRAAALLRAAAADDRGRGERGDRVDPLAEVLPNRYSTI